MKQHFVKQPATRKDTSTSKLPDISNQVLDLNVVLDWLDKAEQESKKNDSTDIRD